MFLPEYSKKLCCYIDAQNGSKISKELLVLDINGVNISYNVYINGKSNFISELFGNIIKHIIIYYKFKNIYYKFKNKIYKVLKRYL